VPSIGSAKCWPRRVQHQGLNQHADDTVSSALPEEITPKQSSRAQQMARLRLPYPFPIAEKCFLQRLFQ
jgi:hypothetical protein